MCMRVAGKDLVPYLPQLMDFLLSAVSSAASHHAKSLAISAVGAAGENTLGCFVFYKRTHARTHVDK